MVHHLRTCNEALLVSGQADKKTVNEVVEKIVSVKKVTSSTQNQQGENLGTNAGDREIHLAVRQR